MKNYVYSSLLPAIPTRLALDIEILSLDTLPLESRRIVCFREFPIVWVSSSDLPVRDARQPATLIHQNVVRVYVAINEYDPVANLMHKFWHVGVQSILVNMNYCLVSKEPTKSPWLQEAAHYFKQHWSS